MNNHLTIKTFGQPALIIDEQPVEKFRSRKAVALILYLACTQTDQNREGLADLLWDASSTKQALSNLRTVLSMIRAPLKAYIQISKDSLRFGGREDLFVDFTTLRGELNATPTTLNAESADRLATALALYEGEFLQGFDVQNAPRFRQWVQTKRRCMHNHVASAFQRLANFYLATENFIAGIETTNQWLQLDPTDESAHAMLIELLAKSGRRAAALAQYGVCQEVLRSELDVEPASEIQQLYAQIKAAV